MKDKKNFTVYNFNTGEWIEDFDSKDEVIKLIGKYANQYNCGMCRMWCMDNVTCYDVGPIVFAVDGNMLD
jgi:hypothetical protein